jgi:hypothetical protein
MSISRPPKFEKRRQTRRAADDPTERRDLPYRRVAAIGQSLSVDREIMSLRRFQLLLQLTIPKV